MDINIQQFTGLTSRYLWPLLRIAAFVFVMPIFSSNHIPIKIKLSFIVLLTLVIAPTIGEIPIADKISTNTLMMAGNQVFIGVLIAFIFQLVFQIFICTGQMISAQTGLGFALLIDPNSQTQIPLLSQFYLILITIKCNS